MAKHKVKKPRQVSSKRLASIAARGLRAPSTLTTEEVRVLAASVLSQAADKEAQKEPSQPPSEPIDAAQDASPIAPPPVDPLPVNQLPPPPPESFTNSLPETHLDKPPEAKPSEPSSGGIIDQIKKIFTL